MRKQIIQISLFVLAISGLFVACKSDSDTTAPLIELKGRNPDSLRMLDPYVDLGATATDDEDGNLTSSITVDDSEINNQLPGSYEVHYSVSDAAGNIADIHRVVVVYADATGLAKTYNNVKDTCGTGPTAVARVLFNSTLTVQSATRVLFGQFTNLINCSTIVADINRDGTITIPNQTTGPIGSFNDIHSFTGTGYVTSTGFFLSYVDTNKSLTPPGAASCRAYFNR